MNDSFHGRVTHARCVRALTTTVPILRCNSPFSPSSSSYAQMTCVCGDYVLELLTRTTYIC